MSTYVDVAHPDRHAPYLDVPDAVIEYLHYLDFVRQNSPRTINGYYIDLRSFFRYMMLVWELVDADTPPEKIDLTGIRLDQIAKIQKRDILNFLDYARAHDNGPKARARKLSALRGFFGYLCNQVNQLSEDPTANIQLGAPKKSLPKYLTADEALTLLNHIQSDFYERDFCILTLFLNCGMRLAELITIDLGDYRDHTIRIVGKGSKERLPGRTGALFAGAGGLAQSCGSQCNVCIQTYREAADSAACAANCGTLPAERRLVRTRIFSPQTAAHSCNPDVPGRC